MKAKNRLRVLRAERRMTQFRLATKAKIQQSRVSYIENGYIEPSDNERKAIARVLGVAVTDVFPSLEAAAS